MPAVFCISVTQIIQIPSSAATGAHLALENWGFCPCPWSREGSSPAPLGSVSPTRAGGAPGGCGEPLAGVVEVAQQPHLQSVLHLGLSLG